LTRLSPTELLTLHASENLAQNTRQGKQSSLFSCSISAAFMTLATADYNNDQQKIFFNEKILILCFECRNEAAFLPGMNVIKLFFSSVTDAAEK
jgi:hypothetical protein